MRPSPAAVILAPERMAIGEGQSGVGAGHRFLAIPLGRFASSFDRYAGRFALEPVDRPASTAGEALALAGDVARGGLLLEIGPGELAPRLLRVLEPRPGSLSSLSLEQAAARSLRALSPRLLGYRELRPRSISLLPVARACQGSCPFCFSKASVSAEQAQAELPLSLARRALSTARARGAERAVITGGGEPGLLPIERLASLTAEASGCFPGRTVLISNGAFLGGVGPDERRSRAAALSGAGLSVLSISRHHHHHARAEAILGLDAGAPRAIEAALSLGIRPRLVAVLQRGGLEGEGDLDAYAAWAESLGVAEITLKELYVSTSDESLFHEAEANRWARANQVPLSLVTRWAEGRGGRVIDRLPWGAPVLEVQGERGALRVAAYTEPSVFWERTAGVCRSWNVLADGRCYASLEDRASVIDFSAIERGASALSGRDQMR